jgi:hypothetical protein
MVSRMPQGGWYGGGRSRWARQRRVFWWSLVGVVGANYLAQIPYYLRVYYFPHGTPPSWSGVALLALTLVWFVAGAAGLAGGKRAGYWLLVGYLATVVAFYGYNVANQVAHGFAPFFHLQTHDPILFVVFGIGYLNFVAGVGFLAYLVWRRRALLAPAPPERRVVEDSVALR